MKKMMKEYSFFILSKRDYSIKEFVEKIKNKYISEDLEKNKKEEINNLVEEIKQEFIKTGYLNDEEYVASYINTHNYGYKKYEFVFKQKGIKESLYKDLLELNKDREIAEITRQWEKLGHKTKEKKVASLMNKGFLYSDIKSVIGN
ncbi:regulatory protein RecX [Fusobacterium sp. PH5-44]|uniref:regulatory protein RecX n=1 Tax=unclassified Fusobacterium TaxID=2648384 RepID=UPI003D1AD73B